MAVIVPEVVTARHRAVPRSRIKEWVREHTNGNFSFGVYVGLISYMVLSVAWALADAFIG